jgi:DNA (cytosine-5)-methyltransferase 1
MSDEGTDWNLIPFHLTQDPITGTDTTPAMSAGNREGCATIGVAYPLALRGRDNAYNALRAGNGQNLVMSFTENHHGEIWEADIPLALTTGGGKPGQGYPAVRDGMAVRRLLPVECERLQGFPDHWTEGRSDSARYRLLGNAVCVPVAAWIGRRLADA